MRRKAKITFEVEETVVLRSGEQAACEFCPQCQARTPMIAPRAIAVLSGKTEREIFRLIEAGEIYFVEADRVWVCFGRLEMI